MFKKKANNSKKVDLSQEAEQIAVQLPKQDLRIERTPLEDQNINADKIFMSKSKPKNNLFTLQGLQKNHTLDVGKSTETYLGREEEKVIHSQMQECFTEFRRLKEKELAHQQQTQQRREFLNQQQQQQAQPLNEQHINMNESPSQRQWLQVQVDEQGGFSPQLGYGRMQDYDEAQGDYQDELIRKTLTKRNYDNLSNNGGISLKRMKQNDATDTFIKKLKKVNAESIKKAISRDLYNNKIKLKQLTDGLREITTHGGSKRKEMEVKEKRLKGLREEMQKLSGVIEYIYYWGDRIKDVSIQGILKEKSLQQERRQGYEEDQF